jgi:hypothetical protein
MSFGEKFKSQGFLAVMFVIVCIYIGLTQFFKEILVTVFTSCCNKKSQVAPTAKSQNEEATFTQIKGLIKRHGQVAYDLRDNPKYSSIILLLMNNRIKKTGTTFSSILNIEDPYKSSLRNGGDSEEKGTFIKQNSLENII